MKRTPYANQGELRMDKISELPEVATKPFDEKNAKGFILSHSEKGNHHLLTGDVEVLERTEGVPEGGRILYAIVREPSKLWQDASEPHGDINFDPGIYEFRSKREYSSLLQQARAVAD